MVHINHRICNFGRRQCIRGCTVSIIELFLIAVGLSMDAFAVAVCKGLSAKKAKVGNALIIGLYFGVFQAVMPLIGYFVGVQFVDKIAAFDHWIAFVLLVLIGGKMAKESFEAGDDAEDSAITPKVMLPLAVATSIDALAVGVSFAFLEVRIVPAVVTIGVTTFALSALGVAVGAKFGGKCKSRAELIGGIVLMLIGVKILIEHLLG